MAIFMLVCVCSGANISFVFSELKCLRWIQFPDRELELDGVLSRFKGKMSRVLYHSKSSMLTVFFCTQNYPWNIWI